MVASEAEATGHSFEGSESEQEAFHPWVLHMDRGGRSFNGRQRNRGFVGIGSGRFEDLSLLLGTDSSLDGRAVVTADFDGDGDEDVFVHNLQRSRHQLWRNDLGDPERALVLELVGAGGLRDPVGAIVTVTDATGVQTQVLQRGAGFASSQGPWLHFGVAGVESIEVQWPGGPAETFRSISSPGRVRLVQGTGEATRGALAKGRLRDPWPRGLRVPTGAVLPPLTLQTLDGTQRVLESEEPVVLHFWSSACAACVTGLETALRPGPEGTRIVPICIDPGERRSRAQSLLTEAGHMDQALFAPFDPALTEGGLGEVLDLTRLPVPTDLVLGRGRVLLEVRSALK